jgi:hypothetical protein
MTDHDDPPAQILVATPGTVEHGTCRATYLSRKTRCTHRPAAHHFRRGGTQPPSLSPKRPRRTAIPTFPE